MSATSKPQISATRPDVLLLQSPFHLTNVYCVREPKLRATSISQSYRRYLLHPYMRLCIDTRRSLTLSIVLFASFALSSTAANTLRGSNAKQKST